MRCIAHAVVVHGWLALWPAAVFCQEAPIARADLTASTGSFSGRRSDTADNDVYYQDWSHALVGTLSGGLYWTDHLKSEAEITWTGTAVITGFEPFEAPGVIGSGAIVERSSRTFKLSAGQLYQFGRNQHFHPFVGAGIDVDRERLEHVRREQRVPVYGPGGRPETIITVPEETGSTTRHAVRPFASAGFKAYFNERGFFRSEFRLQFAARVEQVIWKAGLGVDF